MAKNLMIRHLTLTLIVVGLLLAACTPPADEAVIQVADEATATLQPILSQTPRSTATLVPSRTPLPTFTYTPTFTSIPASPTLSPTPTVTPTQVGIVQSLQRVNVRSAPDVSSENITSLAPGTGVQVIGRNEDTSWYNVRLEDGRVGWVAARLLFLPPTETPFPTATPSPDLTALFLGTPLPTRVLGGGTITPTPPDQVRTGTAPPPVSSTPEGGAGANVPVIDVDSINLTVTALVRGAATNTPGAGDDGDDDEDRTVQLATEAPDAQGTSDGTPASAPSGADAQPEIRPGENGADVFAFCDDINGNGFGIPAPTNLRAGVTIDIWWQWFARTEQQVQDHIDAVTYEISVNGDQLENVNQFVQPITQQAPWYTTAWYIPYGPLPAGEYEIRYTSTWTRTITDGDENFGPGTENPFDQEVCTFTVNP